MSLMNLAKHFRQSPEPGTSVFRSHSSPLGVWAGRNLTRSELPLPLCRVEVFVLEVVKRY